MADAGNAARGNGEPGLTAIYVDADACPVRDEVCRVAERLNLKVFIVTNGSRPILPPRDPNVSLIIVSEGADKADDWIAEHIESKDVCATADIPLAARCLAKKARALSFTGRPWTDNNIGSAMAGREVGRQLREMGQVTGGPSSFTKADRSRFLSALDNLVHAALRG